MGIISIWMMAVAISLKFNRKVEEVALFGVSTISFIYLVMGDLNILGAGTIIAIAITIICAMFCVCMLLKRPVNTLGVVLSSGSIALIAYIVFFVFSYIDCGFYHADNLTYWGINLKYLYSTSSLRTVARNFRCIHPEGLLVWDYYILKTWIGYTESLPIAFHCIIDVILAMPLFKYANGKYHYLKSLFLWIFILLIPVAAYDGYSSILGDIPLALGFAYCIIALSEYLKSFDNIHLFQIAAGIYIIVSTKRAGILVAACFIFIAASVLLQKKVGINHTKYNRLALLLIVVETIVVNSLWLANFSITNTCIIIGTLIVGGVLALIEDNWNNIPRKDELLTAICVSMIAFVYISIRYFLVIDEYTERVVRNYFIYLLTSDSSFLKIPVVFVVLLFSILLFVVSKMPNKNKDNRRIVSVGGGISASVLIFLLAYLILYVKEIAPANGGNGAFMPSFARYMAPIVYAIVLYSYYMLLDIFADKYIGTVFLISVTSFLYMSDLITTAFTKVEPVKFYGFEQAGIDISDEDNVLIVLGERKSDSGVEWPESFCYAMSPAVTYDIFSLLDVDPKSDSIEDWPSEEAFINALLETQIDYIYIQSYTPEFDELYGELFPELDDFYSGMVYEVDSTEDGLRIICR